MEPSEILPCLVLQLFLRYIPRKKAVIRSFNNRCSRYNSGGDDTYCIDNKSPKSLINFYLPQSSDSPLQCALSKLLSSHDIILVLNLYKPRTVPRNLKLHSNSLLIICERVVFRLTCSHENAQNRLQLSLKKKI